MENNQELQPKGGFGTASLVLGLVGLIIFGIPLGILAIVFGGIGMANNQKHSTTGLVLGIIDVVLGLLFMFVFIGALFSI